MEIMNTCLGALCTCIQHPTVKEKLRSITSPKDFLDEAERKFQDLKANCVLRDEELVADRPGMQLTDQVQRWHNKVHHQEKENMINQMKDDYNDRGCLLGSCSLNLWANYKISQSSIKLFKEINNLRTEHDAFQEITKTQSPRAVEEILTSTIPVGNIIKLNLKKVCSYLADDTVSMVGIWGMGGVGKTNLLNEINNSLQGGDAYNMEFKYVIYLVVSTEPQFEKLQKEISERLGLQPPYSMKNDIFEFLKNKDFLLLLDDIWKAIDLPKTLGIPLPHHQSQNWEDRGPRYKHKVIFTTREDDVCAQMKADKKIKVECLDREEAWHLFMHHTNEEIISSNVVIKKLAREVMERCAGLPLALKVIGRAMSNKKTPEEWRHMLKLLIKVDIKTVTDIEESLFHNLKVSYNNFVSDTCENVSCVVLNGLKMSVPVYDLIEHWIALGLINYFGNIGEAFDEGYSIIAKLNEVCLLELGFYFNSGDEYVKLHDVIRDMAMWIVSECGKKKNKWIVCGRGDDSRQFSEWEAGNWKETELISFKGINYNKTLQKLLSDQNIDEKGQVSCASTSPRYPNLQSLFLGGYSKSDHMSRQFVINFFPHMPSLTHLNLSGIPITGLSKEIQVLVNLRYINISNTKIQSLPSELKELKELKYFLFRCKYYRGRGVLKVDGLSTLSMLPKLQVLVLYGNTCLEAGDLRLLMERNRIKGISMLVELVEILGLLKHLATWKIRLHNMQNMHTLQFCDLSYKHDEGLMELGITRCGFEELLINGGGVSLKRINLGNIAKLKQITWPAGTLPSEGLLRLTSLYISYCDSLRSLSWVLHLPCLKTLSVKSCSGMEGLIDPAEMQQASSGLPTFPSLQSLSLSLMAKLVSLSTCSLDFPVLSKLTLFECSKLKKLPFKSSIVNNKFQLVEVDKNCWEDLEWEDTTIRSHLASFSNTL
ncbi:LOW QUALITY PROTEIN: putative disease resistance protein At4g10780 [Dioscorea cayenensis subsp. rotundata]|uniref:LOW QUALITY PROTEIN: putative disease resistance protein At4g10780 n=1 Tax=Dioscorea cayennensis subsp. rotundata TaxID=55577 RepID=A0AB40ASS9_DIOCR|nr:LOW QUALITY PROTEIN: putative disease resistance protein At4g10780 [Dioscorea cayenensis subsp. rotundata]